METTRVAAISGASGLVGGYCLRHLLDSPQYSRILSLGRRIQGIAHPNLVEKIVDLAVLDKVASPPGLTDAFCCLGTTIRKAGSQAAFRAIDHDAVLAFARWAKAAGAQRFAMVSAMGANPKSRVFYSRVKGETDDAVMLLGFASLTILRPSIIDGPRQESRPGERVGLAVAKLLRPILPKNVRAVHAETIARALLAAAANGEPGARIYLSGELVELAERKLSR